MSSEPLEYAGVGFQRSSVKTEAGRIGVDKNFAFDTLDDFITYMSAKIDVSLNRKLLNTSPKKRYESSTAALIELVANELRREFNIRPLTTAVAELNYGLSDGY